MKKNGMGYGSFVYPLGLGFGTNDTSTVFVTVCDDGTVTVTTGAADLGQGSDDAMARIAAEELGVCLADVAVIAADTHRTPFAGLSSGSRQTYVTGHATLDAAQEVKPVLLGAAAELLQAHPDEISFRLGKVYHNERLAPITFCDVAKYCYNTAKNMIGVGRADITTQPVDMETGQGRAFYDFIYGVCVADVQVDTETGQITVQRIVAVHDVGKIINPVSLEGQIEGAVVMGIGHTLMEEVIVREGKIMTPSFAEYLIPTAKDVPDIVSVILEDASDYGPYGARGVSEPPLVAVAPAICNAIHNAVGVRPAELPVTAERLLALLKEKEAALC